MIRFTKMHALGNDFIVLDTRSENIGDPADFALKYCHRKFGIGADQVLLLDNSKHADFKMLIYNADGSEVEMCGNGIRALAKYIWDRGLSTKTTLEIETLAGIIRPTRAGELIRVDMGAPILEGSRVPVKVEGKVVDYPLEIGGRTLKFTSVSMGNPHAIIYVEDPETFPLTEVGPLVENHPLFPKRTNVEFLRVLDRTHIQMRVWERGAGVTMACGTGACAAAVASMLKGLVDNKTTVHLEGGDLIIEWDGKESSPVYMTGPAVEVYEGQIN